MRRIAAILTVLLLALTTAMPAFAAEGNVSYSGDAGKLIFAPGSEYSLTDLFANVETVDLRHHNVKQDQGRIAFFKEFEGLFAVIGTDVLIPFFLCVDFQQIDDFLIIIGNQNGFFHESFFPPELFLSVLESV